MGMTLLKSYENPSRTVVLNMYLRTYNFLERGSLPHSQESINKSSPQPHILFTADSFHYYPTNEGFPRELFPSHFCTKLSDAGPFSIMRAT